MLRPRHPLLGTGAELLGSLGIEDEHRIGAELREPAPPRSHVAEAGFERFLEHPVGGLDDHHRVVEAKAGLDVVTPDGPAPLRPDGGADAPPVAKAQVHVVPVDSGGVDQGVGAENAEVRLAVADRLPLPVQPPDGPAHDRLRGRQRLPQFRLEREAFGIRSSAERLQRKVVHGPGPRRGIDPAHVPPGIEAQPQPTEVTVLAIGRHHHHGRTVPTLAHEGIAAPLSLAEGGGTVVGEETVLGIGEAVVSAPRHDHIHAAQASLEQLELPVGALKVGEEDDDVDPLRLEPIHLRLDRLEDGGEIVEAAGAGRHRGDGVEALGGGSDQAHHEALAAAAGQEPTDASFRPREDEPCGSLRPRRLALRERGPSIGERPPVEEDGGAEEGEGRFLEHLLEEALPLVELVVSQGGGSNGKRAVRERHRGHPLQPNREHRTGHEGIARCDHQGVFRRLLQEPVQDSGEASQAAHPIAGQELPLHVRGVHQIERALPRSAAWVGAGEKEGDREQPNPPRRPERPGPHGNRRLLAPRRKVNPGRGRQSPDRVRNSASTWRTSSSTASS